MKGRQILRYCFSDPLNDYLIFSSQRQDIISLIHWVRVGVAASFHFSSIALCANKEEKARTLPIGADNHDSETPNNAEDLALFWRTA